ncbi:MAG: hydrolase 1, exosortase A system-associated [Kiloniellaceae bacterium]
MPSSPDRSNLSSLNEEAVVFSCADQRLVGILHHAEAASKVGILIVTGGPQYRIGSHRQFLLLARSFAAAGVPTFRFDHRGTGDSEGAFLGFERIGDDIAAAATTFLERSKGLERVVLWGICDAASAILLNAGHDPRIAGLLLVNPWVREAEGEARALVKYYYGQRLLDPVFWRKLFSGEVVVVKAVRGLGSGIARWLRSAASARAQQPQAAALPLPSRMALGFTAFRGPIGLILSGRDLTAREFEDAAANSSWRGLLAEQRVSRHSLPTADHTFSRRVWREEVVRRTLSWLQTIEP